MPQSILGTELAGNSNFIQTEREVAIDVRAMPQIILGI
jgi:hypothetical protein